MTQHNSVFVKFSATKNVEVTLRLPWSMVGVNKTSFKHKSDTQFSDFRKVSVNNYVSNVKLLQTQISEIIQSDLFLGKPLGALYYS